MKRIILLLAIVAASVGLAKAQQPMATLSHEGTLTQFQGEGCIGAAHEAAVDGDTIYLSAGQFTRTGLDSKGITKDITIIGSGRSTEVFGYISFHLAKQPTNHTLIDGLFVESIVLYNGLQEGTSGFLLKNCKTNTLSFSSDSWSNSGARLGVIRNVDLDRCEINSIILPITNGNIIVGSIEARNSKIGRISGRVYTGSSRPQNGLKFSNCHIDSIALSKESDYDSNYFISCIINRISSTTSANQTYQNCVIPASQKAALESSSNVTLIDCYTTEQEPLDENLEVAAGIDLVGSDFLGVDGTVVGIYGGEWYPYSEAPTLPTPDRKASKVEYDPATDKLKVEIKVAN